jgi:4-hydroxy-tetrahydrodipicolinate synthase
VRAAQAGEPEEARRLGARLEPLWVLFRELSSFRVIYAAANSLGLCACDPPLPIRPLSAENRRRVETVLSELGLA